MAVDPGVPAVRRDVTPLRSARSLLKELQEPAWSDHVSSQGLRPPPQLAIRADECDHLIRDVRDDVDEGVVTAAGSVEDRNTVADAIRDTLTSLAF